jgi:hypothetical protein
LNFLYVEVPHEHIERAVYVAAGSLRCDQTALSAGQMAVFNAGTAVELLATDDALLVLFGGAPLDGRRHIWWNFVSSSRERIEKAKSDWAA